MKGTIGNLDSQNKRAFILLFAMAKIKDGLDTNSLIFGLPQCFATLIAMILLPFVTDKYQEPCLIPLSPYCGRHNSLHISIQLVLIEWN